MIFDIKEKKIDPYNVFLAIATNIPQRLKTGFVVQGHKCIDQSIFKMFKAISALWPSYYQDYYLNDLNRINNRDP